MRSDRAVALAGMLLAAVLISASLAVLLVKQQEELPSGVLPSFESYGQMERFVGKHGSGGAYINGTLAAPTAQGSGEAAHSTTNVQVQGVDEADCAKTDGTYLYIASSDSVFIVLAYPPDSARNISRIELRNELGLDPGCYVWIDGIYLSDGRLAVLASIMSPREIAVSPVLMPSFWRMTDERTEVAVFDVGSPSSPVLLGEYGVSGSPMTSRLSDGVLYALAQQSVWTYHSAQPSLARPVGYDSSGSVALPPGSIHFDPESSDVSSFVNLLAVDLRALGSNVTSILAGSASTVYMSNSALYLTYQKWCPGSSAITVGGNVSTTTSSEESYRTTIYRVDVDGLSMHTSARGEVPGMLLNQFSMDERQGHLRLATTSSWSSPSNAVFILDSDLNVTGQLTGIAPGERIFGSRFVGDTLYLVTFRQVDPLFVIDLSDPSKPRMEGQLKVPGFSSYLHPVDEGHLLGIGMQNGSLKLSLFDVSLPDEPREVAALLVPGWSSSPAVWDHKAVLYDGRTGTLALPISTYDSTSWQVHSSIMVFDVNATRLGLRGAVEADWGGYMMRAHYIGDYLYSISDTAVQVNLLSDLSPVAGLTYRQPDPYFFPCLVSMGVVAPLGASI